MERSLNSSFQRPCDPPPPPVRRRFQLLESEGMNFKIDIGLRAAVEVERQAHRWTEFV